MLGSPGSATASVYTAPASASASPSTTRSGRLRGLSYLRSYTHNHLPTSRRSERPGHLARSTSSPASDSPATSPVRQSETERSPSVTQSATIQSGENGWIPTIHGRSGLDRESLHPTSTPIESAALQPKASGAGMTRTRAATALGPPLPTSSLAVRRQSTSEAMQSTDPSSTPVVPAKTGSTRETQPIIRFIPYVDSRSTRPSLQFPALSRALKTPESIVRVGRYSERDNNTGDQNILPVGFKSKVVSRRHCEFWCTAGQWYIKDVKSSSGTFLNHVRLSGPGAESRPYPVNDGDVVQLGIDFKGGEEVIFRCVKIRVECNRGWQKSLNPFNTSAHKRLFNDSIKGKARDSDAASVSSSECSICLNPVAPCQALFVAPCSHVWHYKCIRNLITGPSFPNFLCPNCRFVADLEADVEPPEEDEAWGDDFGDELDLLEDKTGDLPSHERNSSPNGSERKQSPNPPAITRPPDPIEADHSDLVDLMSQASLATPETTNAASSRHQPTQPTSAVPTSIARTAFSPADPATARSTTPTSHTPFSLTANITVDGLMTPRNDAGPFVFDGAAEHGRSAQSDTITEATSEDQENT